jgi:hypothetical protein
MVMCHYLPSSDMLVWERIQRKLVGPSFDAEGRYSIYEGTPYAKPHRHFSHLLALWPLRGSTDIGDPVEHARAVASVDLWSSMPELFSLFGRPACASMNADLGRHAAALDNLTFFARTRIEGSGWYTEGEATVCNEATYMAAYTLADWLLQSWNVTTLAGAPNPRDGPVKVLDLLIDSITVLTVLYCTILQVLDLFVGVPDKAPLDGAAYDAAPAAIATGSFYRLAAEGGFVVSAVRDRDFGDDTTKVYTAKTRFVAIESNAGSVCVVRTDMPRPLHTHPAGVELEELGNGGLVRVGIGKGEGVAIWGNDSSTNPPSLVVTPKDGCPGQYNFWGGGVVPNPESRPSPSPTPVHNKTVLRKCVFNNDGSLSAGQRWVQTDGSAGGSFRFKLDDNSGRCLAVDDCVGGGGAHAVLRPCIPLRSGIAEEQASEFDTAPTPASKPVGCQLPWSESNEWPQWPRPTPPTPCTTPTSQEFVFSGAPEYWRNAIQTVASGHAGYCLDLHGGQDPDSIAVDGCQNCTAAKQCTVNNGEWHFNAATGALTSLCEAPCQAGGWCLTDAAAAVASPVLQ